MPGRKGRPCTGLDTISAISTAATTSVRFGRPRLPGQRAAFVGPLKLHGNAKQPERPRGGQGPRGSSNDCARAQQAGLHSALSF